MHLPIVDTKNRLLAFLSCIIQQNVVSLRIGSTTSKCTFSEAGTKIAEKHIKIKELFA